MIITLTGIRTPLAVKKGYRKFIGESHQLVGNAHGGFYLKTSNGVEMCLLHFTYKECK